MARRTIPAIALVTVLLAACGSGGGSPSSIATGESTMTPPPASAAASIPSSEIAPTPSTEVSSMPSTTPFALTSPAFGDGAPIPARYTCKGQDVSPPLAWTGAPDGTAAFVLFVDDPDGRDWVHWSVLDLPAATTSLAEGVRPAADPPQQGKNDFGKVGYGGPCPPSGTHHYRFTLYALASPLGLSGHPDGAVVRSTLTKARPLATVTLVGTFAH